MKLYTKLLLLACACCMQSAALAQDDDRGFLDNPPVFIDDQPDIPLTLMGAEVPKPGQTVPGINSLTQSSSEFRQNGTDVQPGLDLRQEISRFSVLRGIAPDWAAAASLQWRKTEVSGTIGGFPASIDTTDLGDFTLLAKKRVWRGEDSGSVTITGGIEFPTGKSDTRFDQSNTATNGYYQGYPQRMPLGWQPGGGAINGFLGAAYKKSLGRLSYSALLAAKFNGSEDEDVRIGNTFVAALCGTYGIAKPAALSVTLLLRTQGNDDYPQAPPPGVTGPVLAGTTEHGTTLYVNPSVRFVIGNKIVVGAGVRIPASKPDDGFVPDTRGFIMIYPKQ